MAYSVNEGRLLSTQICILDHLVHREGASTLRRVMNVFFCYTTVFNAIEAFSVARSDKEIQAVDDAMSAMKVLGLTQREQKLSEIFSRVTVRRNTGSYGLIAGVCRESKLPILTLNPERFSGIKQLRVIPARQMVRFTAGGKIRHQIILRTVRHDTWESCRYGLGDQER